MANVYFRDHYTYQYHRDSSEHTTTTQADDEDNPTNWDTAVSHTFTNVKAGIIKLSTQMVWFMENTTHRAMFRMVVNGNPTRHTSEEPKDRRNIEVDDFKDILSLPADGDVTVELQFLVSGGNTPLTVDRVLFEVERKV